MYSPRVSEDAVYLKERTIGEKCCLGAGFDFEWK